MFKGLYCAVVTPFKDGLFDEKAYRKQLDYVFKNGADGIVPNGTTGENPTLDNFEREKIIRIAVEIAEDFNAKVIAGAGTNDTSKTIKLVQDAADWGADGALVITPYYNKPTQEGLKLHFKAVAENSPLPIVMYNVPSRTGVNMSASTAVELSYVENIVCLKEAAGDMVQFSEIVCGSAEDFTVLSGEDALTHPAMAVGCQGVISVAGNVAPLHLKAMLNAWGKGEIKEAFKQHCSLLPLFKALFLETSPAPCKKALEYLGICTSEVRLPLAPVSQKTEKALFDAMLKLDLVNR